MCSLSLRPSIHRLIFCAFDTLVRSGCFFSAVLCHDQFTARHMTGPQRLGGFEGLCVQSQPASLSLPHTKRAFVFLSRFGRRARLCPSFRLSDSRLLFGREIAPNLAEQTPSGSFYFEANLAGFRSPPATPPPPILLPTAWGWGQSGNLSKLCMCGPVCVDAHVCVCREPEREGTEAF